MSIKSEARSMARKIRRECGIPFTNACKIGKLIAQGKSELEIQARMPAEFAFAFGEVIHSKGIPLSEIIKKAKWKGLIF